MKGRERLIEAPGWVRPLGHVEGMVARGRHIFLAGQLGWDEQSKFASHHLVGQVRQALANIVHLLRRAGAGPEHVTRMTWFLVDRQQYERCLPEIALAYSELFGREFPPMTTVAVLSLMHDEALIEMEVTAVVDDDDA
jgi:enamine deaminase RidA (YjgF/YER057c/UK114 family)